MARPALLGLVLTAPALLGLARLLPAEGLGLALRLAAAAACVLLVPGGIFVRAMSRPHTFGVRSRRRSPGASPRSPERSRSRSLEARSRRRCGCSPVSRALPRPRPLRAPVASEPSERKALVGVAVAGSLFAGAVWWTANTIYGDGLFHLARGRKLESFDLTSLSVVNEFRDGGLHPGYAFPLWHSACALVARLADVDPATALVHLPAILTPLAIVLAYAAGAALFRSPGAGIATAAAQVGLLGFSRSGTGSFDFMAQPATASRALIVPALLALVFSFVGGGRRRQVLSIAAASLALALVHPTYAFFVVVPLLGFLVARPSLRRTVGGSCSAWPRRSGRSPSGRAVRPLAEADRGRDRLAPAGRRRRARAIAHYGRQIDVVDGMLRLAPERSREGCDPVAGLLAIPIAGLAAPKRWSAYVLGGSLAVLGLVLVPWAFDYLTDVVSISQGRRLAVFMRSPSRSRARRACWAVTGSRAAWPRSERRAAAARLSGRVLLLSGRGWAGLARLGRPRWSGGRARRGRDHPESVPLGPPIWTAAVALALVAPVGLAGFVYLEQDEPDRFRLTPGLVHALAPRSLCATSSSQTSRRATASRGTRRSTSRPARLRTSPTRRTTSRTSAVTRSSAS